MRWYLNTHLHFSEDARVQQIKTNNCMVIPVFLRCGPDVLPKNRI